MQNQLTFHNKNIAIKMASSAIKANKNLDGILLIEIQIYFSCLLGKRLAFYTDQPVKGAWQLEADEFSEILNNAQKLTDNIYIRFNTVMTKDCPVSDYIGPPPVSDFIIKNQTPYVPSWLNIHFKNAQWQGDYGWAASDVRFENTKQIRGDSQVSR